MGLIKLVMLGDGGVGKSCLTIQLVQNLFVAEYDPTIENSYRKQIVVDNQADMLDILDTAGQEDYSVMRDQYIRTGEGFFLVYSITAIRSLEALKPLHDRILLIKEEDSFPCVVVGNKCDLANQREVPIEKGREWANAIGAGFLETSARNRINVEECFCELVRKVRSHQQKSSNRESGSKGDPVNRGGKKKKTCNLL